MSAVSFLLGLPFMGLGYATRWVWRSFMAGWLFQQWTEGLK